MPRKINNETKLFCKSCKEFSQTIEPLTIHKLKLNKNNGQRYQISGTCIICKYVKNKTLNKDQVKLLPPEIINGEPDKKYTSIERNGGIFPLIPLIKAITIGIAALAGAGATANTVVSGINERNETQRHNRELEAAARGGSISDEKMQEFMKAFDKLDELNFDIIF